MADRDEKIKELNEKLKSIEKSCKPYAPIGRNGSKSDYNACLFSKDYYEIKRELNDLLLADD